MSHVAMHLPVHMWLCPYTLMQFTLAVAIMMKFHLQLQLTLCDATLKDVRTTTLMQGLSHPTEGHEQHI